MQVEYLTESLRVILEDAASARIEIEECMRCVSSSPSHAPEDISVGIPPPRVEDEVKAVPAAAPKWAKEAFRRIARATHPDTAAGRGVSEADEARTAMFREASSAVERQDYIRLLTIAARLGIEVPEDEETQVAALQAQVALIERKIGHIGASAEAMWIDSSDERRSDILVAVARMRGASITRDEALLSIAALRCKS